MNDGADAGAWYLLCTPSLASCRLRAESLARHLHNKLWTTGKFEAAMETGCSREDDAEDVLIVDRPPQPSTFKFYGSSQDRHHHHHHPFVNGHLWQNNLYVSDDEDEFYEPATDSQIGSSPSPPSPVEDEEEIIVNSSTAPGLMMSPLRGVPRLGGPTSDVDRQFATMKDNNEVLYEKLMQFADNNSFSDGETSDTYYDVDSSSSSGGEDNTKARCEDLDVAAAINSKLLPADSSFDSGLNECFDSGVNGMNGESDGTPLACSSPVSTSPSPPLEKLTSVISDSSVVTTANEQESVSLSPTKELLTSISNDAVAVTTPPVDGPVLSPGSTGKFKFQVTPVEEKEHQTVAVLAEENKTTEVVEDVPEPEKVVDTSSEENNETSSVTSRTDWFFLDHPGLRVNLQSTLAIGEKSDDPEDEDEIDYSGEIQRRLLRSTSLKTGKTPPGTPRRKKIVRFADALGLDLEAVRHIVSDDVPNIPASAFTDLHIQDTSSPFCRLPARAPVPTAPSGVSGKVLYPQFPQPVSDPYFMERLNRQKVCLENVVVADLSLHCLIRVLNVSYEKSVVVRYTTNEWAACQEVPASYIQASSDGYTDKFCANLYASNLTPGQRLIFAVHYSITGEDYWDNNCGQNYVLRCHSTTPANTGSNNDDTSSPWYYHFM